MRLPEFDGYEYRELLGEDSFGWIFATRWKGEECRVVKVLKSQATNAWLLEQYFEGLAGETPPIPGTAPIFDYRLADPVTPSAFAMPFYGWKSRKEGAWQLTSLKRLATYLPPESSLGVVRNLARSLARVHENGLFHGGIKPGSLFLAADAEGNQEIRIGDFGQIFMGGLQYLRGGDLLFYASPEQLSTGDFSDDLGYRWDTYAFGVIAFQLLTGHLPRLELLNRQCAQRPAALRSSAAIAYGELTSVTEHFLTTLEKERPVEWPEDSEGAHAPELLEIVGSCLEYAPEDRPGSMLEVADTIDRALSEDRRTAGGSAAEKTAAPGKKEEPPEEEPSEIESIAVVSSPDSATPDEPLAEIPDRDEKADSGSSRGETAFGDATDEDAFEPAGLDDFDFPDEPIAIESPDAPARGEGIGVAPGKVVPFWRSHVVRWQVAAIASTLVLLGVAVVALRFYFKYQDTRDDAAVEAAELQASVEMQAAAYRRAMTEKQKTSEHLRSELNEIESTKSQLVGEAKLARQIVRQTQQNGDEFFELVLENRDTDVPGFRESRGEALIRARKHYERLIEVYGSAPDFIVSTANAYFYLGRIYEEMGEFGKALASFGEAERRYGALLEDGGSSETDFVRNVAVAKHSLGELSMKNAEFAIARHYFTESSRYWSEVRSLSPADEVEATVRIHRNSLEVVECELAINRLDAALDGAKSIGVRLLELQEESPENHLVVGALARSFELTGRILEARGGTELGKEAYEQAGALYGQAVKLNAAADRYRLGLGNSFARLGLLDNNIEKLEAAVDVLGDVVATNPFEAEYQKTLADVYGVLARNQRDGGRSENAIELEREAIAVLQPIIRENRDKVPADVLYSYSQRLAHLAELLGDAGDFDDSRAPLEEAIAVLEMISKENISISQYQRALARARGLAGFACLQSGDEGEAKEHLELARLSWETYMEINPDDADAEQAVKWTSDQLDRLQ